MKMVIGITSDSFPVDHVSSQSQAITDCILQIVNQLKNIDYPLKVVKVTTVIRFLHSSASTTLSESSR